MLGRAAVIDRPRTNARTLYGNNWARKRCPARPRAQRKKNEDSEDEHVASNESNGLNSVSNSEDELRASKRNQFGASSTKGFDPELDLPQRERESFKKAQNKLNTTSKNGNGGGSSSKKKRTTMSTTTTTTKTATINNAIVNQRAIKKKNNKKNNEPESDNDDDVFGAGEDVDDEEDEEEEEDNEVKSKVAIEANAKKESFQMKKKRLELLIEEKEWAVEDARDRSVRSSVKLQRMLDYVNAIEAYKELCSSRVPETVSDFLGNYVNVLCLPKNAKGYGDALMFLGIDFEDVDEDELELMHDDFLLETEHYLKMETRNDAERDDFDDDEEYDDEGDELLDSLLGASYITEMKLPLELHLAQDIDGNWRWLEDNFGRVLSRKPEGEYTFRVISFEDLQRAGLNVNCLREKLDPNELIDFSKCKSFDDARVAMKEATEALRNMEADGWVVDRSFSAAAASWGASADESDSVYDIRESGSGTHLCMMKQLRPLRTMSHVDGLHSEEDEKSETLHLEEAAGIKAHNAFDIKDENQSA